MHMMFKKQLALVFILLFSPFFLLAQVITGVQIDSLVARTLKTFDVPGIAVGVIKDGQLIHAKGYGVRSLNSGLPVDEHTLFGIASNTKAFTAAALGMLADEGKLTFDDKVTDYIPEFKMYDPYVTDAFTIRDLLTHRSGLGLGAGDLMFWPDSNNFSCKDIIHNLRYLKPVSGFRSKYDYDNLMYIVAGEIIQRVSGKSWEEFVETRMLQPLGMTSTAPSYRQVKNKTNIIDPHAPVDGKVKVIRRDWSNVANAAGGIYTNLIDMSKWLITVMDSGRYTAAGTRQLFSEAVHAELWTPHTNIPVRGQTAYKTHFSSYGLGWYLSDVYGLLQVTHTGGLAGIVTQVTLIPELKLGIVVFTNQQSSAAFTAITNTIKDSYLGVPPIDRVRQNHERVLASKAEAKKITEDIWSEIEAEQKKATNLNLDLFTGTYNDNWFGDVSVSRKSGKLWFESKRSYLLKGDLVPYKGNTFIVKWVDRSMDADAFVQFGLDKEGNAATLKLNAISPLTDFSFDFQDLDFTRVK